MKVAFINHFSNAELREKLDLFSGQYRDLGGWNKNIIAGLKGRDDIEIHVITPHLGMRHATQKFVLDGVHYYFFRQELPNPWGQIEAHFWPQSKRNFPRNRKYVRRCLSEIQPDIVLNSNLISPFRCHKVINQRAWNFFSTPQVAIRHIHAEISS